MKDDDTAYCADPAATELARCASSGHSAFAYNRFLIPAAAMSMTPGFEDKCLIFRNARARDGPQPRSVGDAQLREIHDRMQ